MPIDCGNSVKVDCEFWSVVVIETVQSQRTAFGSARIKIQVKAIEAVAVAIANGRMRCHQRNKASEYKFHKFYVYITHRIHVAWHPVQAFRAKYQSTKDDCAVHWVDWGPDACAKP